MIKNIFLDAGGVILDERIHEKLRAEIITDLINLYISKYTVADYLRDVDEAVFLFVPSVYDYIIWKYSNDEETYKRIRNEYKRQWIISDPELVLMEGINDVIPALSKCFNIGILGQYDRKLIDLLEANDLIKFFTYTYTQEQFNITKPDPRYFEQILSKAKVKAGESIMVGDRIDKDIIPAKQIGMKTVRIKLGLHKNQTARVPEENPDYEFISVHGLLELINVNSQTEPEGCCGCMKTPTE
jgi:putative hydrolase of the HAD superfamily